MSVSAEQCLSCLNETDGQKVTGGGSYKQSSWHCSREGAKNEMALTNTKEYRNAIEPGNEQSD